MCGIHLLVLNSRVIDMGVAANQLPRVMIRGRSFLALVVAPEAPLGPWFLALDEQIGRSAGFFADRPVIANLADALGPGRGAADFRAALDGLDARGLRVVGVDGIDPKLLAGTPWARLPLIVQGQGVGRALRPDEPLEPPAASGVAPPPSPASAPAAPPSLLVDRPVRSGQSIYFEEGDITVVGSVASGAEVIAGGSIHVYGALRGRAIAGLKPGLGEQARIFCRRLEAELVAVDHLYRTAETWGQGLHGREVQIRRDRSALRIAPLD